MSRRTHVEVRGQHWVLILDLQAGSVVIENRLVDRQVSEGSPHLTVGALELQTPAVVPSFTWVLGSQAQILILVW